MKLQLKGSEINRTQAQWIIANHFQHWKQRADNPKDITIPPLAYQLLRDWADNGAVVIGYQGNFLETIYGIELSTEQAIHLLNLSGEFFNPIKHFILAQDSDKETWNTKCLKILGKNTTQ